MRTFEQHLDDQDNILSDESKQKVCIITDVVKLVKMTGGLPPTSEQFDAMYDLPIKELELFQEFKHEENHRRNCIYH